MDWNELFPEGTIVPPAPGAVDITGQPPAAPGMNFAATMGPPMEFEAAHVPAATPAEAETRKAGWMKIYEKFNSNPNLQRALALVGAQLAQPIGPGQTTAGATANAAVVGMNAYQLGQQADFQKQMALKKEGREDARIGMEQERLGFEGRRVAETEKTGAVGRTATEAGTRNTMLEGDLKSRTFEDLVGTAAAQRRLMETRADTASRDETIKSLERINQELELRAKMPSIARRVEQEIELNQAKIDELKSQGSGRAAQARVHAAQAGRQEFENQLLRDLPQDQQLAFLTKSGRFAAGTGSALERQRDVWTKLYQGLPADDSRKAGATEAQFVMRMLSEAKRKDERQLYIDAKRAGLTDQEIEDIGLKPERQAAAPATGGNRPGSSQSNPLPWPGENNLGSIPPGTWVTGPDGVARRKKAGPTNPREAR